VEQSTPAQKTAFITGATSGIGLALARLFARDKYNLIIVARKLEELTTVKAGLEHEFKIHVEIIVKDLSEPQAAQQIYNEVKRKNLVVDVLVNNAGFSDYGKFTSSPVDKHLQLTQLNALSPMVLLRLFLEDMLRRKSGKVLNVASAAAFEPGSMWAIYHSSKAYILYLTEALADELSDSGITFTALCPGPTKTAFHEKAGLSTRLMKFNYLDVDRVAKAAYRGLMKGKTVVVPGVWNKLIVFSIRLSPRSLVVKITRWLQEPMQ
jgi:uncharacterized protein